MHEDSRIDARCANDSDARTFLSILRDSINNVASRDYSPEIVEGWAPPINSQSVQYYIANPEREIRLIGSLNGEPVGIGSIVVDKSELRACYVSSSGLRHGVGTAIVQHLESIALKNGLERFVLHATLTAEHFYQALGYSSDKRIKHTTSNGQSMEAIAMSKELGRLPPNE